MAVLLSLLLLAASGPKTELRIYVFTRTDPSGLVDADQKRRMESVEDLRDELRGGLKQFQPVLVDTSEQAQVRVELLSAGLEDLGDRTGWNPATGFMGAGRVAKKKVIRARVSIGDYVTDIANEPLSGSSRWKSVAAYWQREFRKWVNDNSERLATLLAVH